MKAFFATLPRLFRSKRGNAAVEFALTFPTLMVVTLMIFDLGQALFVYTTINNVAADGARYAALHGINNTYAKTPEQIQTYIQARAVGLDPNNLTITLTYTPNNTFTASRVEVQVDYELSIFLSGIFSNIITNTDATFNMNGTSTMDIL